MSDQTEVEVTEDEAQGTDISALLESLFGGPQWTEAQDQRYEDLAAQANDVLDALSERIDQGEEGEVTVTLSLTEARSVLTGVGYFASQASATQATAVMDAGESLIRQLR